MSLRRVRDLRGSPVFARLKMCPTEGRAVLSTQDSRHLGQLPFLRDVREPRMTC
ncbi:hypothetical protein [Amycolatopsis sp. lyj-90]|uniref:hypothetical protein n=1 Tax=Amycolatopsis sp. lyj-90 TaxID=2789285 RepID=UPI003978F293